MKDNDAADQAIWTGHVLDLLPELALSPRTLAVTATATVPARKRPAPSVTAAGEAYTVADTSCAKAMQEPAPVALSAYEVLVILHTTRVAKRHDEVA